MTVMAKKSEQGSEETIMGLQTSGVDKADQICTKLSQYFGSEYDVSSNNVNVFTIKSRLRPCVYVESEDIMIVNNIVSDFGLAVDRWRLVAANGQVGLYCVLTDMTRADRHFEVMVDAMQPVGDGVSA
jgi:hypothetical protein